MIVVNLVQNIAMLVMLAALYQVLEARGAGGLLKRKVLAGILFGVVTVMGIMAPVRFAPGIIFDGRSIVLSIAGLFGGPVVGFVAAAICGAYRLWLGGGGAAMGVSVAAESALVGVVFYYLRRKGRWRSDLGGLAAVGFLVHGLMLLLTFLLPAEDRPRVWRQMGLLLLTVYPAGTIFLGLLFLDYERQASARASLAASEERYRTTLASIGDAVIATDRDGRIEFMNAVAEKLTGWTTAEARGQPLETVFSIVNEQTHEPVDDPVRRVIREGKIVGLANHTLLRGRDGTERPIADSGAPIRDETGTIKGVVLTFRDQTSERAAERALRESEAKFRILTEESRTPVYVIQDGRFRYVNAAEADLLGYSREELLSLPSVLETVAHEDRQRVLENIGRRLAGDDVTLDYEFSIVRKDGARRLVEVTGTATTFDGRPAVLGTAQDITERKRAEIVRGALLSLATGLSEAHTEKDVAKSIFAAADHLWHWDAGTLEMLWQGEDKMENVLCIDTLDGVRKEVPPTGQRERPTPRIMRVMEKGPELILRTPDQMRASDSTVFGDVTRLSASIMAVPVRQRGVAVGALSIQSYAFNAFTEDDLRVLSALADYCSGALERIRAQGQIRRQAELLDAASEAIWVSTLDHRITYWNRGAEKLYGWNTAHAMGRAFLEIEGLDRAAFEAAHAALLREGHWTGELSWTQRGGHTRVALCRWTLLRGEDGQPSEVLGIHTDITEHKQLEASFLRAQRMEGVGALAGGLAHDLNNILTPILMSVPLIRETVHDPNARQMLDMVEISAQRGAEIIKQLLTFARGKPSMRVPVALDQLLTEVNRLVGETFPRHLKCCLLIGERLWPVMGDPTQIQQAVINLCVNARDAMPESGALTLAAQNVMLDETFCGMSAEAKPGPYVCVTVQDTGVGIPPEDLPRVFDPFFTTKEVGKGTGLGLATVLGIVRGHGGFLHVQSKVNMGTTVELFLPASPNVEARATVASAAVPPDGHGELILVVDDEAPVRTALQRTLERHGYRVLLAAEGNEAMALFAEHRKQVRAVLTDMMMPGMDGPALITKLRQTAPDVPLLGMTGIVERLASKEHGILGLKVLLTKPFAGALLLSALADALQPE